MTAETILDILKESVILTVVVVGLMMVVEVINFYSEGKIGAFAGRTKKWQSLVAGILGATPGCIGGYVSVSMYTKGVFSFGALMSMMVATTGDEAFLMLAMIPKQAVIIILALMVLGIATGLVVDRLTDGPEPTLAPIDKEGHCHAHHHKDSPHTTLKSRLLHTAGHALKVFLWTFGIMMVVGLLQQRVDIESWISGNTALMVLLAALIGLIPQSGPHMIFVTMFASGLVPLPVLLASCVSQDGHAGLPLIAETKKSFFIAKGIKLAMALVIGYAAMLFC